MIYEIKDTNKISPLFGHWEETLIWSCLQGIMGKIYANDLTAPTAAMAVIGEKAKIISRYATKKEPPIFNKHHLEKIVASLPKQYTLSMIDSHFYKLCKSEAWSKDLVSQFSTYEKYRRLGIGVVISKDGLIISGASSYSRYQNGIEIEIDTRKEYRRNGFACICAAKLILECLKRNLYPSWDAHNKASAALAEKLGYHYSHAYTALEIWDY